MEKFANSIRQELKIDCPTVVLDNGKSRQFWYLYKIPRSMGSIYPEAFKPNVVSIGPYHRGSPFLKGMEIEKRQFLELNLWSKGNNAWALYVEDMAKMEGDARDYYPELGTSTDSQEFVSMMLLDGYYILGLLYPWSFVKVHSNEARNTVDVWHDLLLLENQIPFSVVERIYEQWAQDFGDHEQTKIKRLRDQATSLIESVLCYLSIPFAIDPCQRPEKIEHLLHLFHTYFKPTKLCSCTSAIDNHASTNITLNLLSQYSFHRLASLFNQFVLIISFWVCNLYNRRQQQSECSESTCQNSMHWHLHLHRAVQYDEVGIKFRAKETTGHNQHSLLDIIFSNNVLEIPCLCVDESTAWLFGNLIAFEQTNRPIEKDVTAYVMFMSQLMDTPEDVALLSREGIVRHQLNNRDVSTLFANLAREVMFDFECEYHLRQVRTALEERFRRPKKMWRVFKLRHFSSPLAWLAALVAFVCSVIQALFSILAYVRPPNASSPQLTSASAGISLNTQLALGWAIFFYLINGFGSTLVRLQAVNGRRSRAAPSTRACLEILCDRTGPPCDRTALEPGMEPSLKPPLGVGVGFGALCGRTEGPCGRTKVIGPNLGHVHLSMAQNKPVRWHGIPVRPHRVI
ncbi:hypothetical protein LUZ61_013685 [Rhynchospora tenuis]|uniref:Uncharacterized protein n=1 Tax=Rhynchospora tenuis TaxID=198213 RepID=A0AAD5W975_9POAL|nr:hypothetical protein LUZ61_013685 [Rhynchospora tenuis]